MCIFNLILSLILAPLFIGLINRTKAIFAGGKGPPLLQLYYDLNKLLRKGRIYSRTTSWIFQLSPIVGLIAIFTVLLFIPFNGSSCLSFTGDIILIAYLLGLARLFMVLAALDTGSSFEGMGTAREVAFASFVEPSLFLILASLAKKSGALCLSDIYIKLSSQPMDAFIVLTLIVLLIILLVENSRIPIDDPNTHLELTMIHEVMVLDNSSAELGFIFYSSALKIWLFGYLLIGLLPMPEANLWLGTFYRLAGMGGLAIALGSIESLLARVKIHQVFILLVLALAIACFTLLLAMR